MEVPDACGVTVALDEIGGFTVPLTAVDLIQVAGSSTCCRRSIKTPRDIEIED